MDNRELLFCVECQDKRWFELAGNIKTCEKCLTKSSYRAATRKRWVYAKSHPDTTNLSPYNQPCDDNTQERFDQLQSRLHLLSPKEREVVELLWEGKTQREVAAILNITQQRVTSCLSRARKKLVVVKSGSTGR